MRPVERITLPKHLSDALGGKVVAILLIRALKAAVGVLLVDLPWIAYNRHAIAELLMRSGSDAMAPSDCDCFGNEDSAT